MGGARAAPARDLARSLQRPSIKYFSDLPEDTFEAFLSAPVISRNRVVGVINVQHRARMHIPAANSR